MKIGSLRTVWFEEVERMLWTLEFQRKLAYLFGFNFICWTMNYWDVWGVYPQ